MSADASSLWDPAKYLDFADHRSRPFVDLLARVAADAPRTVADLGCGPGTLTSLLQRRWPGAKLDAVDSSPEMVAAARSNGIEARVLDVHDWQPSTDTNVVVTNAVLQWVPDHPELLRGWLSALPAGAWLAMQVPGNFDAPSHREIREVAAGPQWPRGLDATRLRGEETVLQPQEYAEIFSVADHVEVWETTYLQRLTGADPVLEWVTGTALRPIRAALGDADWLRFRAVLAERLRAAYPPNADGSTWFPFRRIFAVARL